MPKAHKTKTGKKYNMTRKKGGGVKRIYIGTKAFKKRVKYLKKKGRL